MYICDTLSYVGRPSWNADPSIGTQNITQIARAIYGLPVYVDSLTVNPEIKAWASISLQRIL